MKKSVFKISKMDCPSEEQLIRMKLEGISGIQKLDFDIPNRELSVYYTDEIEPIDKAIQELSLNSSLQTTEDAKTGWDEQNHFNERRLLWIVLLINFSMFVLEIITGFIANSMGLVADSLDMLADSIVYGLSLFAVGSMIARKKKIARISGYFQMGLAIFGLAEVIRRFVGYEEVPTFQLMIIISLFALAGNSISFYLLQKSKSDEVHMQASKIFTSNDVMANIGVILAGVVVYLTNSKIPDLIIGTFVFILVFRGALRILKLAR
jgi:Co/Zn/Cd efflux system component